MVLKLKRLTYQCSACFSKLACSFDQVPLSSYVQKIPVLCVMGHIDHGKTSLIKALAKDVNIKESGGITQRVNFFSVKSSKGATLTFIDTPGHSLFSNMRLVSSEICDICILIVAINDGLMTQTIECLELLKKLKKPFIVAVNKIDIGKYQSAGIKQQLSTYGVNLEEFGGETPLVEISAKHSINIDLLLNRIDEYSKKLHILTSFSAQTEGKILESEILPNCGRTASVILKSGLIKRNDFIATKTSWIKIKEIRDERNYSIDQLIPGKGAKISTFDKLPTPGESFHSFKSQKEIKKYLKEQKYLLREKSNRFAFDESDLPRLKFMIKCDCEGTKEALIKLLLTFKSTKCSIRALSIDVGQISSQDISDALAFDAKLYLFKSSFADRRAESEASAKNMKINNHQVIYSLIDNIANDLRDILPKELKTELRATGKVIKVFEYLLDKKKVSIGGIKLDFGTIERDKDLIRVKRNESNECKLKINSLKIDKKSVENADSSEPFGIVVDDKNFTFQDGESVDIIRETLVDAKLDWDLEF